MLTKAITISVLGTDVCVLFRKEEEDEKLVNMAGYYDSSKNEIVVKIFEPDAISLGDLLQYQKEIIRHEIIHAFLHESGVDACSCPCESWATNEEMVDWFAIQSPKIFKLFEKEGLL
jgi:hypothetical protein